MPRMATRASTSGGYGEASIRVLKGLEPVKQRPGMYTRTESPLHVVQEVIDNAADEALAGAATAIDVTVHADGSVSVDDDGRGIPVGLHPEEGVSVVEIVFTRLHAGGKFDKGDSSAYSFSGGLHGVGVSVTNALAKRLEVSVWRAGQVASMAFAGGDVVDKLSTRKAAAGDRKSGTRVRVWPDPRYFDSAELPRAELTHVLRSKAVLMPGVKVSLTVEKAGRGEAERQEWLYAAGLSDYLMQTLAADPVIPLFEGAHHADGRESEDVAVGEGASLVRRLHRRRRRGARELRQPDPDGRRRHPRVGSEGRPVPGGQGLHRHAQPAAQGREGDARGRVLARQLRPLGQGARPAVPGPDQGAAEQPRGAAPGLQLHPAGARALAAPARRARAKARRSRHPPGADAPAREPEGREEEGLGRRRAARQAHRLREPRPAAQRAVPGRGRFRRRQRQDGPRQGDAGDPAAARQGAQRLGGRARPPVRQQRDPRHRRRRRRRSARRRRRARLLGPALRQGLHPRRRRRRRLAHPGAAADAVLPPLPEADRARPRLRRQAAALSRRCAGARQEAGGQDLRPRRRRAARRRSIG